MELGGRLVSLAEMKDTLAALGYAGVDVQELFNPGRFKSKAAVMGMTCGTVLDMTCMNPHTNQHWDFSRAEDKEMAKALIETEDPYFVIGAPPCRMFSLLMAFNTMDPEKRKVAGRDREAERMMKAMTEREEI